MKWKLCIFFALCSHIGFAATENVIQIGVSDLCPYVCFHGEFKGYVVNVLNQVMKKLEVKYHLVELPYLRMKQQLRSKQIDLALMYIRDIRFDSDFLTSGAPLGLSYLGYVSMKPSEKIYFISDLKGMKVIISSGILSEDASKIEDVAFILKLSGKKLMERKFEMLRNKRVDVAVNDYSMILYHVKGKQDQFNFGPLSSLGHNIISLVALKDRTDLTYTLSERMRVQLEKMRASGELQKILKRYDLKDWNKFLSH